jgi:hypothetical protein
MTDHKHEADRSRQIDDDGLNANANADTDDAAIKPNPPRTTKGGITAPKFGSAGSGGAELEPGPERD